VCGACPADACPAHTPHPDLALFTDKPSSPGTRLGGVAPAPLLHFEPDTLLGAAGCLSPGSILNASRLASLLQSPTPAAGVAAAAVATGFAQGHVDGRAHEPQKHRAKQQGQGGGGGGADQPTDFRRLFDLLASDCTTIAAPDAAAPVHPAAGVRAGMAPPAERPPAAGAALARTPPGLGADAAVVGPPLSRPGRGAGLMDLDIEDAAAAMEVAVDDLDVTFLLGGATSKSWLASPPKPRAAGGGGAPAGLASAAPGGGGAAAAAAGVGGGGGFDPSRPFAALFGNGPAGAGRR
jgi:hypothetical protein